MEARTDKVQDLEADPMLAVAQEAGSSYAAEKRAKLEADPMLRYFSRKRSVKG